MAPTRYTQGHQPTEGPAGDGHALAARDSDSVVQGYGASSYDDGHYQSSSYNAGDNGQKGADDGSYTAKTGSTTRQDSSLDTAEQASKGSQQASGYQQDQQNTGSQSYGSQYSGSQYGSSRDTGSQNTGTYSGSQYSGSQNTNSQNSGSQNTGSQSSGSQSGSDSGSQSGWQSGSHNTGSYQQNSNAQNAGQEKSQQGASNSGYSQSGQAISAQQQAHSDTANTNSQQQSSWSQQNAKDSQSQPSQQNPSNANHEQSSYNNNQAVKSSHEQQDKAADLSDEHRTEKTQKNEAHNLSNHHATPAETVQTAQQPTPTLPTVTTVTMHPTSSFTTSAATTASTHTTLPSTTSTSSATSSPTPAAAKDSDDGSYHKATGALAGLLGVALVAGFVIFWIARRKRQQKREAHRSKMVHDAFRQSHVDSKQRSAPFCTNFLGTAVGTGVSALSAVRRSLAMPKLNHHHQQSEKEPMPEQGHIHHPCDDGIYVRGVDVEDRSGQDSDRNDSIAAEKAANNESTPTLVVSPSESMARDQTPTVRRVVSGRPQMESSESIEPKSGLSHNTQESEAEPSEKAQETSPSTPSSPPSNGVADNAAQENRHSPRTGNGQNLLAITSMVPSSSSIYRVEIAFQPKKVGQLDLREGQSIIIRQSFDDGWVSYFPLILATLTLTNNICRFSVSRQLVAKKVWHLVPVCHRGPSRMPRRPALLITI